MSSINIKFQIDTSQIAAFERNIDALIQDIVDKAAYDISALAGEKIPVDTGAAKNSIFVKTSTKDTFAESMQNALASRAKGGRWHKPGSTVQFVIDQVDLKKFQALVGVAVNYGMALEYGTMQNSNPMTAHNGQRPYLTPSVDEYRPIFLDACRLAVVSAFKK